MKYIYCCRCGEKKATKHTRYKKLLEKYNNDKKLLGVSYVCLNCRLHSKAPSNLFFNTNIDEVYQKLQNSISQQAKLLHTSGIQNQINRTNFYNFVKKTLEDNYLRDFIINVKDNKVVSIDIDKIPLVGKHSIIIKE